METTNEGPSIHDASSDAIRRIREATKDLEDIQGSCNHKDYALKNLGPEEGKIFSLRRVCKECSKDLGFATQKEIDEWSSS